jgi:plastocyanin
MPDNPADTGESTNRLSGIPRRTLLKAIGAGTAVSFGSGTAAAAGDGPKPPRLDPLYGYATANADEIPESIDPDHEVTLRTGAPTPGEHGPLFHFEPTGLSVDSGDVVQFTFATPDHSVTAYHPGHGFQRRVPADVPPFSSPIVNAGGAWLYRFDAEGVYDMYCAPHHILGMTMRVVVGDLDEADVPEYEDTFEGSEEPPLLAPFSKEFLEREMEHFSADDENTAVNWVWLTPQEVLDTAALDPANIQEGDGEVPFDAVLDDIDRISGGHEHE